MPSDLSLRARVILTLNDALRYGSALVINIVVSCARTRDRDVLVDAPAHTGPLSLLSLSPLLLLLLLMLPAERARASVAKFMK